MEIIWGRNAVHEALRGKRRAFRVYVAANAEPSEILRRITEEAERRRVAVQKMPRHDLDRLAGSTEHQGVVAQVEEFRYAEVEDILALAQERGEPPFILLLDSLQDPQNLGSLLRTSEAVGVHGVIIPRRRAAEVTPAVVKASAGAVEHMLVAQVTNLNQTIAQLKQANVWIVGVDAAGDQEYDRANLTGALGIVVGGEGAGIARLVKENCDFLIRLPMKGQVSSLNAAVAGSVVLYEAWRQRRA